MIRVVCKPVTYVLQLRHQIPKFIPCQEGERPRSGDCPFLLISFPSSSFSKKPPYRGCRLINTGNGEAERRTGTDGNTRSKKEGDRCTASPAFHLIHPPHFTTHAKHKRRSPGLVKFVAAFAFALPAAFSQPGDHLSAKQASTVQGCRSK